MTYSLGADGFFNSVNGHPVIKEDVRPKLIEIRKAQGRTGDGSTLYIGGHPIGILFHETSGFQNDIAGTMYDRGYPTAPFCVGHDGSIRQYLPIDVAGWHAFDASKAYVGIEHTEHDPDLPMTTAQLEVSALLSAAIVEWDQDKHGFAIPLKHIPTQPPPNLPAGFRDHRDGTAADWNKNGHTDHLATWTWDHYLSAVLVALGGDDMATIDDIVDGEQAALDGKPIPANATKAFRFGYRSVKRDQKGLTLPEPGVPGPHTHTPNDIPHIHTQAPTRAPTSA